MVKRLINSEISRKFIKFGIVGVLNTGLDFGIYFSLTRGFDFFQVHYLFAHSIAFVCATVNSFALNRSWTFHSRSQRLLRQYAIFFLLQVINLGFSSLIIIFAINGLGWHDMLAKALASIIVLCWNFILSRKIVFKKEK